MDYQKDLFVDGQEEVEPQPYERGFWHGLANAVEVYIQSREEQLLAPLREKAS
jgi:hypothetical protein